MTVLGTKLWSVGEVLAAANLNAYTGPMLAVIDLDVFMPGVANTNWSTVTQNASAAKNGYKDSTGAVNASIEWNVALAAGTWTLNTMYQTGTDCGIITVALSTDASTYTTISASPYNASAGTIDCYTGVTGNNQATVLTGITIATNGVYRLRFKMATKNASSSSYRGALSGVQFVRTA